MYTWLLSVIAILVLVLIPWTPNLLRLRVRFFRWLHWDWAANLLENYFEGWVLFVRIMLFLVAAVLLAIAWIP